MIHKSLMSIVFICALLVSVVSNTPLSFALKRTGLEAAGLHWESARGRIWSGVVSGVRFKDQPLGLVRVTLKPEGLLKGRIRYHLNWRGEAGQGVGTVEFGRSQIRLSELRGDVDMGALQGFSVAVRQIGGLASFRIDELIVHHGRCEQAAGSVTSDLIRRASARYGGDWSPLAGDIRCEKGMLFVPLEASSSQDETMSVQARIGLAGASSLEARVSHAGTPLASALAALGFWLENGDYVYRREINLREGML